MAVSEVTTTATMLSPNNPNAGGVRATGSDLRLLIQKEARTLEESCEKAALRDTLLAANWHDKNLLLGMSSTIIAALAAFSRGSQFADWQIATTLADGKPYNIAIGADIISILVLSSAILTSILTFLSPSEKSGDYHHFSNKLRSLRDRVRSFTRIDCSRSIKDAALCEKFDSLVREKSEIDSSHPIVPNWAYGEANAKDELRKKRKQQQEEQVI
jgi:hypothetical protein